ncbi:MAG: hypothetical protein OEV40_30710 [Acidimicrobiia bacterium]|nr:hypothetical protein [Acidimicrobiia bacterium]
MPASGGTGSGGAAPPTAFSDGPPSTGPTGTTAEWDRPPSEPEGPSGLGRVLLVMLGALVALGVAGGAFLLLRDSGSDTTPNDAAGGETATEGTGDTAAPEGAATGGDDDGLGSGATEGSGAATDDAAAEAESEAGPTTTELLETTTTADPTAQVAQFRSILADNGLTSDGLSDEDISTFSTTFCIFAVAAEGPTEYERFRSERVAQADSELTEEELSIVIDAAVVVFCPEEADRLGVSL